MKFDKTNITNIDFLLLQLKSNSQDKTVIIGQLESSQLLTILNALTKISHIETIIFEATSPVSDNLNFITDYIKKYEINYQFLHTDETQRMEILSYLYSAELTVVIDDSDNKICVLVASRATTADTLPPNNLAQALKYAEEVEKLLPAPPPSPKKHEEGLIELLEENFSDGDATDTTSKRNKFERHLYTAKRYRRDFIPSIDPPHDDNTSITSLTKLTHSKFGIAEQLHKAICNGDEKEILLALTAVSEEQQKKLLNEYCHEEFVDCPSVLKLALGSERFTLIATLINLGANPFQRSGNGYTLLHDIILDMQPEALRFFLDHVKDSEGLLDYINTPFPGRVYDGYYALDIICLEANQYFKNYDEAIQIENQVDANSFLEIVILLLSHSAQSKLLNKVNCDINSFLKLDNILNLSFKNIWELVLVINSLHKTKEAQVPVETEHQNNATKLLAQEWLKKGILSPTQPVSDPQFESLSLLVASGAITQEEADGQFGILESFQSTMSSKK